MKLDVALLQLAAPGPVTRHERFAQAEDLLEGAGDVDLIVLPEMWATGYFNFARYEEEAETLDGEIVTFVREISRRRNAYVVGGSFVERDAVGGLHNTAFLVDPDGELRLTYRKIHVFGYRSREAELLTPGDSLDVAETDLGIIGLSTCYDIRFPELYRAFVDRGAQMLVVPAAWPQARREHWRMFTSVRAVENQCVVLACNQAGGEGEQQLAGTSRIVDPWGTVLAEAGDEPGLLASRFDTSCIAEVRAEFPVLADRVLGTEQRDNA